MATEGGTVVYLDELTNDELRTVDASEEKLREESTRVDHVVTVRIMTGLDLSYFTERQRILRERLS